MLQTKQDVYLSYVALVMKRRENPVLPSLDLFNYCSIPKTKYKTKQYLPAECFSMEGVNMESCSTVVLRCFATAESCMSKTSAAPKGQDFRFLQW
jgi:hypothetical protein